MQEEERAAQAPNVFSPAAIEVLQQAPADRDLTRLKLVVKDLKNTAFFQVPCSCAVERFAIAISPVRMLAFPMC